MWSCSNSCRDISRMTTSPILHLSRAQRGFFRAADAVASLSDHNRAKLGCVLVDKHRIISSGHNSSTRCSPLQKQIDTARFGFSDKHKGPVHAETSCLLRPVYRQALYKRLSGAFKTMPRLYVPSASKRRQARVFQRRGRLFC